MSDENGLVRNARVRITALHRRFIEVQIPHTREIHCLPRITFSFNPARSSWTMNHKQFPLRPAYAMAFNGCQGLTLEKAVLDLCTHQQITLLLWALYSSVQRGPSCASHFFGDGKNSDLLMQIHSHTDSYTPLFQECDVGETFECYLEQRRRTGQQRT